MEIINKGDLPNYEHSYKHIMRFQMQKTFQQFINKIDENLLSNSQKMMSAQDLESAQKGFMVDL